MPNKVQRVFTAVRWDFQSCVHCCCLPAALTSRKRRTAKTSRSTSAPPWAGIHVSKNADVQDVGIAVYPGAHPKQKDSDGGDKSANVNISGFEFGLKVVALEYQSDDAPEKLVPPTTKTSSRNTAAYWSATPATLRQFNTAAAPIAAPTNLRAKGITVTMLS